MASDPQYDSINLPVEQRNVGDLFKDKGIDSSGRATKTPWRIDKPSKRVSAAPVTMWIYNVSPRKHQISTLPGMPRALAPCPEGKEYGAPLPIREITLDYASMGDYKLKAVEVDDIDLAKAIVCPSCGGEGTTCKDSADLRIWGVFYSTNNPPSEAELSTARDRLTVTLSNLIKIADHLYEDQSKRWQIEGANGDVYRMAAKAMKIQRPWCTVLADMDTCPACGKTNPKGAMVCSSTTCGVILDYRKALKFRKITKAEYNEAVVDGLVPGEQPITPAKVSQ